jgi:hypothetical protein
VRPVAEAEAPVAAGEVEANGRIPGAYEPKSVSRSRSLGPVVTLPEPACAMQDRDMSCAVRLRNEKTDLFCGQFKNSAAFSKDVGVCFEEYKGGPERCHSPYPPGNP